LQGEPRDGVLNLIRIEFYSGIVRFLCHSKAFLYTSVTTETQKLYTVCWFSRPWCKSENRGTRAKSR